MTLMAACLLAGAGLPASAQDSGYKATPVTISRDKVRRDGKLFYSHVVLEKQTLFSISKAYGVTLQDIYDSNPTLNLETEGLKTYQILLIPVVENPPAAQEEADTYVNISNPEDDEVYAAPRRENATPQEKMQMAIDSIEKRSKYLDEPNVMSDEAIDSVVSQISFFDDEA